MDLRWNGDKIAALIKDAGMDGLQLAAEHLLTESSKLVPHEEGDLERSGDTDRDDQAEAVSVFYDRPYAVRQHEDQTLRHDEGRSAKYLEKPMQDEQKTMLEIIARQARKPLR